MNGFNGFGKKKKEIEAAELRALDAVGIFVKGEYISRLGAHVRTGNLRGSPAHEVRTEKKEVRVGSPVVYAPFLEYGTSRSRAYPCLRPAVDENEGRITELYGEVMRGVL